MLATPFDATLIGTGKIFSPGIEATDWIGYHATSSYYSADIDTNGLQQKKPLPVEDLEHLVDIATRHGEDGSDVSGFIELRSLSFTPTSELALFYVRPESFGGQGLLHVTRLIDALLHKHVTALTPDERAHLIHMQKQIALIRSQLPVIYAVNLVGLSPMAFGKHTLVVYIYAPIPQERLVAKMLIDKPVDYATIDVKAHNNALRAIFRAPGTHYIKQMPVT